ncbi:MAG: hypothetical protein ACE5HQ_06255 [Gemmatimonadota bacterium]
MDWDVLAPMIFMVVLTLTVGGVILLRPLSRRLGDLLETMAQERRGEIPGDDVTRIKTQLETVASRLALLEERQDFTDQLLAARQQPTRLPSTNPPRAAKGEVSIED